eukprot:364824-Chlamydomonas_euryale.AAC.2
MEFLHTTSGLVDNSGFSHALKLRALGAGDTGAYPAAAAAGAAGGGARTGVSSGELVQAPKQPRSARHGGLRIGKLGGLIRGGSGDVSMMIASAIDDDVDSPCRSPRCNADAHICALSSEPGLSLAVQPPQQQQQQALQPPEELPAARLVPPRPQGDASNRQLRISVAVKGPGDSLGVLPMVWPAAGTPAQPQPEWHAGARARTRTVALCASVSSLLELVQRQPELSPALRSIAEQQQTDLRVAEALRQLHAIGHHMQLE